MVSFEVLDQGKTSKKSNKTKNPNVQKIANHQPLSELFGMVAVTNAEKVIDLGLPIDTLVQKNYDDYIDAICMLLYGKNQALYAGMVSGDKISEHRIVVTLSTLVIMCQMGKLDLLRNLAAQTIIPISLIEFLHIRIMKSIEMQVISPGKLIEMPVKWQRQLELKIQILQV